MKVKVFITIEVDPEEYPVPADEDVGAEIEDNKKEKDGKKKTDNEGDAKSSKQSDSKSGKSNKKSI